MKGFMKKGVVVIVAGMLLAGCGEELTTLTESEEGIIVSYSAGTVAKFNKRQQDGITAVVAEQEETEKIDSQEEELGNEPDAPDNPDDQSNTDNQEAGTEPSPQETTEPQVSLSQALGIAGVEVEYNGYELSSGYEESNYLSMTASEGNTYFIMKFTLTNTGSEGVVCDILNKRPVFTLTLNGGSTYTNEVTLLSNDLSTYSESLAAGAAAEAVLIFEVPLEETAEITTVQAGVQVDQVNGTVTM